MLQDYKRLAEAEKLPLDRTQLLVTPFPNISDPYPRMEFALLFDGLQRYIDDEANLLIHPELVPVFKNWLASMMPLSFEDMSKLYSRVDASCPRVRYILRKYSMLMSEYRKLTLTHDDPVVPAPIKIMARYSFMTGLCIFLGSMSTVLFQIREGIEC